MDPFKASLLFLPSWLMIKVSSDARQHTYTMDMSNVYGRALFWTVKDKQTEYVPKVNFQLEPKVQIKAKALIQPQWVRRGGSIPANDADTPVSVETYSQSY